MQFIVKISLLLVLLLTACVGTDYQDDPIRDRLIVVSHLTVALMPNEQIQIEAVYFNQYGVEEEVQLQWNSTVPSVADVSSTGVINGKTIGQTIVQPSYQNFYGPQIQITVVNDPNAVATVEIDPPAKTNLIVGDQVQLQAVVKTINGNILTDKSIEWFSENNFILTVTQDGLVTAAGVGIADIHAKSEGIKSNIINFSVDGSARTGTFVSAGGYKAAGSAKLELLNNNLILTLGNDFDTDFVLGTYIYLANSTNGPTVRSSGYQVAQIYNDGAKTFDLGPASSGFGLNTYKYVVVLCYPASATFGYAELK